MAVVHKSGLLYVYSPWLQGQIQSRWKDDALAKQLATELVGVVNAFGGKMDSTGFQVSLPLAQLKGREREMVDALTSFMARVELEKNRRIV